MAGLGFDSVEMGCVSAVRIWTLDSVVVGCGCFGVRSLSSVMGSIVDWETVRLGVLVPDFA